MKMGRYSDPQILSILRQAPGGKPVPDFCREHGMSSATFYRWRAKFGGMDASMISQMKPIDDDKRSISLQHIIETIRRHRISPHNGS